MPITPQDAVLNALKGVVDPELGDNIVDLGMVQGVQVASDGQVTIRIALTIAGCPLMKQIRQDVERAVANVPNVIPTPEIEVTTMDQKERSRLMDRLRRRAGENAPDTQIPGDARVLAIASGKGGVGKSSITANLSVAIAALGYTVGVLDADISGFSIPRMLGMDGQLRADDSKKIIPIEKKIEPGLLKVISMGFLADESSAIMWRGLLLNRAVQQFLQDVSWGDLDYLLVDMPPGTGDIQMGLARMLPHAEMIIVTTPPEAAQKVAQRAASMARKSYLRIAGVIENMSDFTCEHGTTYELFGSGGGERLAMEIGVPLIGSVPLDVSVAAGGDSGRPAVTSSEAHGTVRDALTEIARRITTDMAPVVSMDGCTGRMLENVRRAIG